MERYDCEGYSLTDGKHKRFGLTRQELYEAECRAINETADIREAECPGHSWQMNSHEERKCRHCGAIQFMPDF